MKSMHTCIRDFGYNFKAGNVYAREDIGNKIYMHTENDVAILVSGEDYEEHFLFDSEEQIAARG